MGRSRHRGDGGKNLPLRQYGDHACVSFNQRVHATWWCGGLLCRGRDLRQWCRPLGVLATTIRDTHNISRRSLMAADRLELGHHARVHTHTHLHSFSPPIHPHTHSHSGRDPPRVHTGSVLILLSCGPRPGCHASASRTHWNELRHHRLCQEVFWGRRRSVTHSVGLFFQLLRVDVFEQTRTTVCPVRPRGQSAERAHEASFTQPLECDE